MNLILTFSFLFLFSNLSRANNGNFTIENVSSELMRIFNVDNLTEFLTDKENASTTLETLEKFKSTNDSTECVIDFIQLLIGVFKLDYWAIEMIDAQGKIPNGITDGNLIWYGSYTVCKKVLQEEPFSTQFPRAFKGKFCWALFQVDTSIVKMPVKLLNPPPLKWGLCIPDSCNGEEIYHFLAAVTDFKIIKKYANITAINCLPEKENFWKDRKAVIALIICIIFFIIILLATTYDICFKYYTIVYQKLVDTQDVNIISNGNNLTELHDEDKDSEILDIHEENEEKLWQKIIFSFSIRRNFIKLLTYDKSNPNLDCLNGIRVITMMWIILSQTYITGCLMADNLLTVVDVILSIIFEFVSFSVLSCETFFLLSGLLVSYTYFKEKQKKMKISWIKFYLFRYLRLTPLYILFIIVIDNSLINYLGEGPFWPTNGFEENNCDRNWWWNILYINNFKPTKDSCLEQSWFLANLMQFYIFAPLILILLSRCFSFGVIVSSVFILISWITSGVISTKYQIKAEIDIITLMPKSDGYYKAVDEFYYKPYLHIAPYVIGILFGYFLQKTKFQRRLNVCTVLIGWILSAVMGFVLLFSLYKANERISIGVASIYHSLSRTAWSITICWVILACSNGYGGIINFILGLPLWQPLSRLTYCAYLLHMLVINVVFDGATVPVHFSHLFMIFYSAANIVVIYIASIVISLVFEMPFLQLLKLSPVYSVRSNE